MKQVRKCLAMMLSLLIVLSMAAVIPAQAESWDSSMWTPKDSAGNAGGGWTKETDADGTDVFTATDWLASIHYNGKLASEGSISGDFLCGKNVGDAGNTGLVVTTAQGSYFFAFYRVGTNVLALFHGDTLLDIKTMDYAIGMENWFHLEMKWDEANIYVYMDGKLLITQPYDAASATINENSTCYASQWEQYPKVKNLKVTGGQAPVAPNPQWDTSLWTPKDSAGNPGGWTKAVDAEGNDVFTATEWLTTIQYNGKLDITGSMSGDFLCGKNVGELGNTGFIVYTAQGSYFFAYYRVGTNAVILNHGDSVLAVYAMDYAIGMENWFHLEMKWDQTNIYVYMDEKLVITYPYDAAAATINENSIGCVNQWEQFPQVKNLQVSTEAVVFDWDSSAWNPDEGWMKEKDETGITVFSTQSPLNAIHYTGKMGTAGSVEGDFLCGKNVGDAGNTGLIVTTAQGGYFFAFYRVGTNVLALFYGDTPLAVQNMDYAIGTENWFRMKLQWDGTNIHVYMDDKLMISHPYDFNTATINENSTCRVNQWEQSAKVKNLKVTAAEAFIPGQTPLWKPERSDGSSGGWMESVDGDGNTVYTAQEWLTVLRYADKLGASGSMSATVLCGKNVGADLGNTGIVLTTASGVEIFAYYRVGSNAVSLMYNGGLVDTKQLTYPVGMENWFTMEMKWQAGAVYVYMDGQQVLSYHADPNVLYFNENATVRFNQWEQFPQVKNLQVTLGEHTGTQWDTSLWDSTGWETVTEMGTTVLTTYNNTGIPGSLRYLGSMEGINSFEFDVRYNTTLWPDGNIGFVLNDQDGVEYFAYFRARTNSVTLLRNGTPVASYVFAETIGATEWKHYQVVWTEQYLAVFVEGKQVLAYDYTVHGDSFGAESACRFSEWGHPASLKNIKAGQSSVEITDPTLNKITLSSLFGHNMILQRNKPVKIFGYGGEAGDTVRVSFAGQVKTGTVGTDGWAIYLDPMSASATGRELTVEFIKQGESAPLQTITLSGVLVGELWLCSGQSNMHYTVGELVAENNKEALADYYALKNLDMLRVFDAPVYYADRPTVYGETYGVRWATPNTTTVDYYSAIGLGFAAQLQASLGEDVPVGIISAALKGSYIEEWLDTETLADTGSTYTDINSRLYNGMIHNMKGMTIGGILWYQGEANAFAGGLYRTQMAAYADMYRGLFEDEALPIIWFQLPQFSESFWPHFRQTQWEMMNEIPNTYAVCGIDLGVSNNIHPTDKFEFSGRAAGVALKYIYGLEPDQLADGQSYGLSPYVSRLEWKDDSIVVHLQDAVSLTAGADGLDGFEGFNGSNWVKLNARIQGNTIVLTGDVANITKVRYLHSAFFYGDIFIYNEYGLPVAPFTAMGVEGRPGEPAQVTGTATDLTFEAQDDMRYLTLHSTGTGYPYLENGKLFADADGELKAMFNGSQNATEMDISVKISLQNPAGRLNAGVYVLASGAGDLQDQVNAYNVQLESSPGSRDLVVNLHYFSEAYGFEYKLTGVCLYGYFENGSAKSAVTLRAVVKDSRLDVYIDGELLWQGIDLPELTQGGVGLRSQVCDVIFDDLRVVIPADSGNAETRLAGDVNGDGVADSEDAQLVLAYTVGLATLTDEQRRAADLNGDGLVNSTDARLILQL